MRLPWSEPLLAAAAENGFEYVASELSPAVRYALQQAQHPDRKFGQVAETGDCPPFPNR